MDNLLGFDFYGTGNIGDELMLDGLPGAGGAADAIPLQCVIRDERRITTLARRFPAVQWTSAEEKRYRKWMGVGSTPIQCTVGCCFGGGGQGSHFAVGPAAQRAPLNSGLLKRRYRASLIEYLCDIQSVLSSRCHGLLTAAWLE
jgi:hypothetical protein